MELPKRKQNRLKDYDYSQNGAYFITICTQHRLHTLSKIEMFVGDGFPVQSLKTAVQSLKTAVQSLKTAVPFKKHIVLTNFGDIVMKYINLIHDKYPTRCVDKYVIMPNHIHLIVMINSIGNEMQNVYNGGEGNFVEGGTGNPSPTIGMVMGWFKYQTTKCVNEINKNMGNRVWQRSYHDHIIRHERAYRKIWNYIDTNPTYWEKDCFYEKTNLL